MSDDYTREALEEIARRRKALVMNRALAVSDQALARYRDLLANTPGMGALLAHYLRDPESTRVQRLAVDGWETLDAAFSDVITGLAMLKLHEITRALDGEGGGPCV